MDNLTPLAVMIGENGSGKSTVADVFTFLSECFLESLDSAFFNRGSIKSLRTKGVIDPIVIEFSYRECVDGCVTPDVFTYHVEVDQFITKGVVVEEWLKFNDFKLLDFKYGKGGIRSDKTAPLSNQNLAHSNLFAADCIGQLVCNVHVSALRAFVTSWFLSKLTPHNIRVNGNSHSSYPDGALKSTGSNLLDVLSYFKTELPQHLDELSGMLSSLVPSVKGFKLSSSYSVGEPPLILKDSLLDDYIPAQYNSDGALKLLAYLVVLYNPIKSNLICLDEPENNLYPSLIPELMEECRNVSSETQMIISTHSPLVVNQLEPNEVWVLTRDIQCLTRATNVSFIPGILAQIQEGAKLGQLWMENFI